MLRPSLQTHKTGGVVVLDGLCVSKGLEDGVSLEQLGLQLPLALGKASLGGEGDAGPAHQLLASCSVVGGARHRGQILDDLLGVLGLAGSGFSAAGGGGGRAGVWGGG